MIDSYTPENAPTKKSPKHTLVFIIMFMIRDTCTPESARNKKVPRTCFDDAST